ncbi:thermitase [Tumebacillus sp. BK434]|uniref:S8 family peptidase n=1 Tax=Tumebacillus sp. BK434 TaxID=2512169 RepID=UPI00104D0CE2|nr:S8 family peptidase [Tumebacillus sp. BK434]TCP58229.1 thermitase [Tumebacillus sp. BK434]
MADAKRTAKLFAVLVLAGVLLPAHSAAELQSQFLIHDGEEPVEQEVHPDRFLLKVRADKTHKVLAKYGLTLKKKIGRSDWKLVAVPDGEALVYAAKLTKDRDVLAAEPDYVMRMSEAPNDPSYDSQYHLQSLQLERAWGLRKSAGQDVTAQTVAILDTGVDLLHPDLAAQIVSGYDAVNDDWQADDDQGHGTHCAGIAAAIGNNGVLGTGVNPQAKIMPVKVLDAHGQGYTSDILDGMYFAVDAGADVLNLAFDGGGYQLAFQDAVNYAWSSDRLVVAAAGNRSSYQYAYPAAYSNVISVASTDGSDALSYFSNRGTWVDLAAPGASIYSTRRGGGMTTMSGTSMAAAEVAGLATLIRAAYPDASNEELRDRLFSGAEQVAGAGSSFWYGRVNAYNSLQPFY